MALMRFVERPGGVAILGVLTGSPRMLAAQAAADPSLVPAPEGVTPQTHYGAWDGAGWVLTGRPTLPAIPGMQADIETVISRYPEGAAVEVHSGLTGQQAGAAGIGADGELRLTLKAGPWRIVVNPPFPHVAQDVAIEVSE